jgi:NitT/TauT family transport system substrate-binding protein
MAMRCHLPFNGTESRGLAPFRRGWLGVVRGSLLLLFGWLLTSCREPAPPLRVGCNVWTGYEPLHLAAAHGYFSGHAIQVIEFPSAADVIRAYRNGALEVAAVTADEALQIAETDPAQRIFLVCDFSRGGDAIVARQEFPDLKSLRGRRIGVEPNALGAYVLARALQGAGMSAGDVTVVPVGLEAHEEAFARGQVDAVVTFDPRGSRLLAGGARSVFDSSQIPGEIVDLLLTRPETLQRHRAELRTLVGGWFKALDELSARRAETIGQMARRQGQSAELFTQSLQGLELPDRAANRRLLGSSTNSLAAALRRLARVMDEQKLIGPVPDPAALLDDSLVSPEAP